MSHSSSERHNSAVLTLTGLTVWLTGLSAAGKTTLADAVAEALREQGLAVERLDGDALRARVSADLGFGPADRAENVRRAGELAVRTAHAGTIAVVSLISPYAAGRRQIREAHSRQGLGFIEVFVDTPLAECQRRDPDGLYARAERNQIANMSGLDDPYEAPVGAEVHVRPGPESVEHCVAAVLTAVRARLRP
jgi:bifunctional enzyme CysN/CysC